ncbi:hypothetical protein A3D14_00385 [Candidatus Saccharibacteria bacterium RIFCSPHIGHO2_02_FULL_47_12]|nr:MAG: hypothetical protein A3D14_00385 [Candidatus Saccharibacteria bacterium RIFCSPHIGHO2_02_FULL_47_12]
MEKVPYHGNPGNAACALACYTMAAQYLLPDEHITFEQMAKIARMKKGYVVWGFPAWKWMMDRGIHIADYDKSDIEAWAKEGIEGLRKTVAPKEFKYYQDNTEDLEKVTKQLALATEHTNFTYKQCHVTWDMIVEETKKPGICDVTLDGRKLHRADGFSVHRVILIEITDNEVIFHDPTQKNDGAYKHEPIDFFRAAVESLDGPELARYSL